MRRYVCVILGLAILVAGCDGDILGSVAEKGEMTR